MTQKVLSTPIATHFVSHSKANEELPLVTIQLNISRQRWFSYCPQNQDVLYELNHLTWHRCTEGGIFQKECLAGT